VLIRQLLLPNAAPVALFLGVAILLSYLAVGKSYSTWDPVAIWAAKGYGIALEESIYGASTWGAHALGYPLNIPIAIANFELFGGDVLPLSKTISPVMFVSSLIGVYSYLRLRRIKWYYAVIAVATLATVPELLSHSMRGYANIPLSAYLALGSLVGTYAMQRGSSGGAVISGLLLGLASWTRVEALLYSIACGVGLAAFWFWKRKGMTVLILGIAGVIATPWAIFYRSLGASGTQAEGALGSAVSSWLSGDFNLQSARFV
jgi:hypothetical protein